MLFRAVLPTPKLRPYITRYWSIVGHVNEPVSLSLMPDGGVHLLLNLGDGVRSEHFGSFCSRTAYLVGAMLRSDEQQLHGEQRLLGISFKPGAFCNFHRSAAMSSVTSHVQEFDDHLPQAGRSLEELAQSMDRFYLERLVERRGTVTHVVADIEARRGRVRLDALAKRHATSGRQLERLFEEQLGLTPKQFADLTRFLNAQRLLEAASPGSSLAQLALDAGYYDQAHLNRHFKRFTGKTPRQLVLSDFSKSARD